MRKTLILIPALALLCGTALTAGSGWREKYAAKEQARLDKALAGKIAGKPQSCIRLRDAQGTESYGETTLLFRASRNLVYRTETRGSCSGIGNGKALISRTWSGELCRGDMASAADLSAGFETGHCSMGDFVPYRKG